MSRSIVLSAIFVSAACSGPTTSAGSGGSPLAAPSQQATPPQPPAAKPPAPPVAARGTATDAYHGVTVADPYRWLEGDGEDVKAWSDGQDRYARTVLDGLPDLAALRAEYTAIMKAPVTYYQSLVPVAGKVFAMRKSSAREQPELIVMSDPEHAGDAKVVLDPTAGGNAHATIDWFVPSPDGTKVAVSISNQGSENGDLHLIDLDGKDLEPAIPNVQRATGGGDVAWRPDGKALYYTRYPSAGERPDGERDFWMQVWLHELGKPATADRYEMGKDLPKIAEILLDVDARGRVLASVQNGDGGTFRHYLRDAKGRWAQLTDWADAVVFAGFGPTADLWLISRKDAPRGKVLRLPGGATKLADAKVVVPEGADAIVTDFYSEHGITTAHDRLYLNFQTGGPSELRAFTRTGGPAKAPAFPPVSTVDKPVVLGPSLIVASTSYMRPWSYSKFTATTGALAEIAAMSQKPPVDLSAFEVHRELATSKDGTRVPVNIVFPKGAPRDGSVPCLATGYGGYNIAQRPVFAQRYAPLLARGVCFVDVNLRGGSEFGEDWHRAGMLERKQNVFDDFAAALTFLVEQKYTRRDRLAIIGGSNGGLLMGAMITQHPDLVRAVVAQVGIFDMLRVERSANGAYNVPEFGSVADEVQFRALHAYSPYHRVAAGTAYPPVLFTAGANDGRVAPWSSRKMVAALQAARSTDAPILLRISATSGHGAGTDTTAAIDERAHIAAFVLWQLRPPAR
jgi:prolyl oligopeptidase